MQYIAKNCSNSSPLPVAMPFAMCLRSVLSHSDSGLNRVNCFGEWNISSCGAGGKGGYANAMKTMDTLMRGMWQVAPVNPAKAILHHLTVNTSKHECKFGTDQKNLNHSNA